MINAVGREIPGEILKKTGKEPFKGAYANDNHEYKKAAPTVRALCDPGRSKMVENIHAVSYTHLRAHETRGNLVCRLLLEKKK